MNEVNKAINGSLASAAMATPYYRAGHGADEGNRVLIFLIF